MPAKSHLQTDILIFGSGIAGLMTAQQCLQRGYNVVVVEHAQTFFAGATTRSGDLIHAGGFHSALIDDPARAMETGQHCAEGHRYFTGKCPEGILSDAAPVYLAIHSEALAERSVARWNMLNIRHQPVSAKKALAHIQLEGFNPPAGTRFFQTEDKPFNWRLCCEKIQQEIIAQGGIFFSAAQLAKRDGNTCHFVAASPFSVTFHYAIHTTGYGVVETLKAHAHWAETSIRAEVWKSLSLRTTRCNQHGFLFIDRNYPSFMPSGGQSIINVSQLDTLTQQIDFSEEPQQRAMLSAALQRVGLNADHFYACGGEYRTCLKPNLVEADGQRRVDINAIRLSATDIIGLPGKATTSPLLAAKIVEMLED